MSYTLPSNGHVVNDSGHVSDHNNLVNVLTAAGTQFSVLNAAYAGGADPGGSADSTAAFVAAKAAAVAAGYPLLIPPGTYKITSALNWKTNGLIVIGAGTGTTIISQATSNIPVVQVAGNYQDISGLTLTYATPQAAGNTAANTITFGDDSVGSCFECNYHELNLVNGQTGMAIDPAIVTVAGMFSCRLANINISGCSSSFISLDGNNSHGAANCTGCVFENIYCAATGGTVTGFPVLLKNWDEFVFTELNIEHCTVSAQDVLNLSFVGNAVFSGLHFEALTTSLNGGALIHLSGAGSTTINGLTARFNVYTGSASNPVVKFFGTGATTLIVHGSNESSNTVTTPSHPYIDYGTATNCTAQITGQVGSQTTVNTVNAGTGDVAQFGFPFVTGAVPITSGYTAFGPGGGGNTLNGTSGASPAMVAGTWYYAAFYIPYNCTLTGLQLAAGTTGAVDNWVVALWRGAGGAALANSALAGIIAPAASTKKAFPFTATVAVTGPAVYIAGVQSNGTTAKFLAYTNAVEGFITGSVAGTFGTVPSLTPSGVYNQNLGPEMNTY